MYLVLNSSLKSVLTAIIILAMIGVFILLKKVVFQKKESIYKVFYIIAALFEFIMTLTAIFGIMLIWEYRIDYTLLKLLEDGFIYIEEKIGIIIGSVAIFFVASLIINLSKMGLKKVGIKVGPMQKRRKTIAKITTSIIKYIIGLIAILVVLALWGVNVVPALAGLGIAGLVIGLGAQKFINDLISGAFIIFEHHFDVGDIIEVSGFKGEVIDIGLKTTKLRNWKGEVKILANGDVNNITNFSQKYSMAVVEISIAYEEDAAKVIKILTEELKPIINDFPVIIEEPIVMGLVNLGDNGVGLRAICKTEVEQHYAIEREIRRRVQVILREHDIEIPFPQLVVSQKQPKES
ncbi:MAG: mechanosensitive ion channel family protein [Bacilli bacterium]